MSGLMKSLGLFCILCPLLAHAGLEVIPSKEMVSVFSGPQQIPVLWRNATDKNVKVSLQTRLFQASSATVMPVAAAAPWKTMEVLAGQTVLENVPVTLPAVRTTTTFELRFLDEAATESGKIQIRAYPDGMLKELAGLDETNSFAVLDPDNLLKPELSKCNVSFEDLEENAGFDSFAGRLAIIGPFSNKDSVPDNLKKRIQNQSTKRRAIVWIQPPSTGECVLPVYIVREGDTTIVVVCDRFVANLAGSPQAQHNLLYCAQLALNPGSLQLPNK